MIASQASLRMKFARVPFYRVLEKLERLGILKKEQQAGERSAVNRKKITESDCCARDRADRSASGLKILHPGGGKNGYGLLRVSSTDKRPDRRCAPGNPADPRRDPLRRSQFR